MYSLIHRLHLSGNKEQNTVVQLSRCNHLQTIFIFTHILGVKSVLLI